MPSALIYDCEIAKAILGRGEPTLPGIEYCRGWHDFAGMGISCIGVYDYLENRFRIFVEAPLPEPTEHYVEESFEAFQELVLSRDLVIGFNNGGFDDPLVAAVLGETFGVQLGSKSWDLLSQVWMGVGLKSRWGGSAYGGYGLDDLCRVNLGRGKSGNGALAPVQWQRGMREDVLRYCLDDVKLTKDLVDLVIANGSLKSPKGMASIPMWKPF